MTRQLFQPGPANPNWKGGRSVASNGYVLVKDRQNPMADVRGYVYEHRLVMSVEVGRSLTRIEQVHHGDEIKTNNDPLNLELCSTPAHHRFRHRRSETGRQRPDESNLIVSCACGCGATFAKFDADGRRRRFISGHNPRPAPTISALVSALASGPMRRGDLIRAVGLSRQAVAVALTKLKQAGRVRQVGHGRWAICQFPEPARMTATV